jgi:hypothetical protein
MPTTCRKRSVVAVGDRGGASGSLTKLSPRQRAAVVKLHRALQQQRQQRQLAYTPIPQDRTRPLTIDEARQIAARHAIEMGQPVPAHFLYAKSKKTSDLIGRGLEDLSQAAIHTPGGLYATGKAVGEDTSAATHGDLSFKRSRKLGAQIGESMLQDLEHPGRHPGYAFLDALAALSAGAGTVERLSAATRAARAGEIAGTAKALVKRPPIKPRLIEHGDLKVPLQPSRNQAVRYAQALHDAAIRHALKNHPEGRVASYATKRLGASLDETRRYREAMQRVPAIMLQHVGKKLGRTEQAALRLTSEQALPDEAITFHSDQLAKGVNPKGQRRQLKLLADVKQRGMVKLNGNGEVVIDEAAHPRLAAIDQQLAKASAERDKILTDTGQMTKTGARVRIDKPNLVRAGARAGLTATQAEKRLAEIDATYNGLVDHIAAGYSGKDARPITAGRNVKNSRVDKARRLPTVKAEARALAEKQLNNVLATKTGDPTIARLNAMLDEAHVLRGQLEAHREAVAFGDEGLQAFGGHAGDVRPGRNYVPYYQSERRGSRSAISATPGPVVGRVRSIVPKTKTFSGKSLEQANVPPKTTALVSRQIERAYRFANSDEFRRTVAKSGANERRTSRDVLLNTQALKNAKVPEDLRTQLTGGTLTLEEMSGHSHAFDAWRERILPGIGDRFRAEVGVPVGTAAPKGYTWVDRNLLGELAHAPLGPRGRIVRTADTVNAAQTAATVYYKLGHIPTRAGTNFVANIIQGSAHPLQLARSARLWRKLSQRDRFRALAAAGEGGIHALPSEAENVVGVVARKGAGWWSKHVDAPFRFNSLAYEARRAGITTAQEFRSFLDALQNPSQLSPHEAAVVDAIAKRANREAIAYDRLNEFEKRYLRRVIWFYPWVSGSVRFAGNTILEHPFKAAGLANVGRVGEEAQQRELGKLPPYAQGVFKVGDAPGGLARVEDWSTVSPFATPSEVVRTVTHSNHPTEDEQLARFLNPTYAALGRIVYHLNSRNRQGGSTLGNAIGSVASTTPEMHLVEGLQAARGDTSKRVYPPNVHDTVTRFLGGTEMPRNMNLQAAHDQARKLADVSPAQRSYASVFKRRNAFYREAKRLGVLPKDGRLPSVLRQAFNLEAERLARYARASHGLKEIDYQRARFVADTHFLADHDVVKPAEAAQMLAWADKQTDIGKLKDGRRYVSEHYYQSEGGFLATIRDARRYLEKHGAKDLP